MLWLQNVVKDFGQSSFENRFQWVLAILHRKKCVEWQIKWERNTKETLIIYYKEIAIILQMISAKS